MIKTSATRIFATRRLFSSTIPLGNASKSNNVVEAGDSTFKSLVTDSKEPVIVDFYADWCGPCRMIAPILSRVAESTQVKVVKVDVDKAQRTAADYSITALPTVVGFRGGKEVSRFMGLKDEKYMREFAESLKK